MGVTVEIGITMNHLFDEKREYDVKLNELDEELEDLYEKILNNEELKRIIKENKTDINYKDFLIKRIRYYLFNEQVDDKNLKLIETIELTELEKEFIKKYKEYDIISKKKVILENACNIKVSQSYRGIGWFVEIVKKIMNIIKKENDEYIKFAFDKIGDIIKETEKVDRWEYIEEEINQIDTDIKNFLIGRIKEIKKILEMDENFVCFLRFV